MADNLLYERIRQELDGKMPHVFVKCGKVVSQTGIGELILNLSEIVIGYEKSKILKRPLATLDCVKKYLQDKIGEPKEAKDGQLRYDQDNGRVKYTVIIREKPFLSEVVED